MWQLSHSSFIWSSKAVTPLTLMWAMQSWSILSMPVLTSCSPRLCLCNVTVKPASNGNLLSQLHAFFYWIAPQQDCLHALWATVWEAGCDVMCGSAEGQCCSYVCGSKGGVSRLCPRGELTQTGRTEARLWPGKARGAPGAWGANKYTAKSLLGEVWIKSEGETQDFVWDPSLHFAPVAAPSVSLTLFLLHTPRMEVHSSNKQEQELQSMTGFSQGTAFFCVFLMGRALNSKLKGAAVRREWSGWRKSCRQMETQMWLPCQTEMRADLLFKTVLCFKRVVEVKDWRSVFPLSCLHPECLTSVW